jgi:hypothetical protein
MRSTFKVALFFCQKLLSVYFFKFRKKMVLNSKGEHHHTADTLDKIEKQVLGENCKRRAEESVSRKPIKIIRTVLRY